MTRSLEPSRDIRLGSGALLNLAGGQAGRLQVLQGGVWLTEEGELADTFLHAGQEFRISGRPTLLQASADAVLQLCTGPAATPSLWQRWRERAARWQFGPSPAVCG